MAHKRGKPKGDFCSLAPETNCPDCPVKEKKNGKTMNYAAICEPKWSGFTFLQRKVVAGKQKPFDRSYEAHHILCVASVLECIQGKHGIQAAVRETEWCINQKVNMYAMPLWGHTVKWYCNIGPIRQTLKADEVAPLFANIPQHDQSHNAYQEEVETALKTVAAKVKDLAHDLQSESLAKKLNRLSEDFRQELETRGNRAQGTHKSWERARKDPTDGTWCHPFSMAPDSAISQIPFPTFDDKTTEVMERIAEAVRGG